MYLPLDIRHKPKLKHQLGYKVSHEATDATQSVSRTRVRGGTAESILHFGKKFRMLVEDPGFSGGNACRSTVNPKENRQVRSRTRQDK